MSTIRETKSAQQETRRHSDLPSQYRPIGIGAVAGALVAANRDSADDSRAAANSNERVRADTLAA